jgi:PhnB protein
MSVRPVPEGYHTVTSALTCKNAAEALEFYKKALGAKEVMRMTGPDGKVGHAEMKIGDSTVFIGDEFQGMSAAPTPGALPSASLFLYVEEVDKLFDQAVGAGCKSTMPVTNMFWGDRYGKLVDPYGHHWGIATHVEDVAPDEMKRREAEWMAKMSSMAKSAGKD